MKCDASRKHVSKLSEKQACLVNELHELNSLPSYFNFLKAKNYNQYEILGFCQESNNRALAVLLSVTSHVKTSTNGFPFETEFRSQAVC